MAEITAALWPSALARTKVCSSAGSLNVQKTLCKLQSLGSAYRPPRSPDKVSVSVLVVQNAHRRLH